ncbi:hypothetical protein ACFL11_01380 [Patescibacteria group bacterium]
MNLFFVMFIILALTLVYFLIVFSIPELYIWPRINNCPICNKDVFAWQEQERRTYNLILSNNIRYPGWISACGIVHKFCFGMPSVRINIHNIK